MIVKMITDPGNDPPGTCEWRYYDLNDGILSSSPTKELAGIPIYSAEKLLDDIANYMDDHSGLMLVWEVTDL